MAIVTISGQSATNPLTIVAPSTSVSLSSYLFSVINDNGLSGTPQFISISIPTTVDGITLSSLGRTTESTSGFAGTVFRLHNGSDVDIDSTLQGVNSGFSEAYRLPANTDTFVISPFVTGSATHILRTNNSNITRASSNNLFSFDLDISGNDFTVIGSSNNDNLVGAGGQDSLFGGLGNDELTGLGGNDTLDGGDGADRLEGGVGSDTLFGGNGNDQLNGQNGSDLLFGGEGNDTLLGGGNNDVLVGDAGNDSLTGNNGSDIFRFTNQGIDTVNDFNLSSGDRLEFVSATYIGAPAGGTAVVVNTVASQTASTNIYVDTQANILKAVGNVRFAYATDTDTLLFDADGNFSAGSVTIANTNNLGIPTASSFAFV